MERNSDGVLLTISVLRKTEWGAPFLSHAVHVLLFELYLLLWCKLCRLYLLLGPHVRLHILRHTGIQHGSSQALRHDSISLAVN